MTVQTIDDLVTQLLQALDDDDAPEYRARLQTLRDDHAAQRALTEDDGLRARLMPELRKLRPLGLWVRDRAEQALSAKTAMILDGGICQIATSEAPPAARGRECWLEVPALEAEARLPQLGAGWGMLVVGEANDALLAALRRQAPLRALGVVLQGPLSAVPSVRLDLVLRLDPPREAGTFSAVPGARVLWAGVAPEAHGVLAASGQNAGIVCSAAEALTWAIRLAVTRAPRLS